VAERQRGDAVSGACGAAAESWQRAGTLILHKMLGELSYEGLLRPRRDDADDRWLLALPGEVGYRFAARRGAFECWVVAPDSATRQVALGNPGRRPIRAPY